MTMLCRNFVAVALLTSYCFVTPASGFAGPYRRCRCQVNCAPCLGTSTGVPSAAVPAPPTAAPPANVNAPPIIVHVELAPAPTTPPKTESKPAPRPLPDGVTAVTPEQLLKNVPNFFYYDYNFEPEPGKRVWIRANDRQFLERYPSGKETAYDVLGRSTVEQMVGTIVIRVEAIDTTAATSPKEFRVFIADKTLESRRIYFDHPDFNSGNWVYLGEMKSVE